MSDTPFSAANWATCTLQDGVTRGDTKITDLRLREPKAGELRGLNLQDLMRLDVGAIITILPRISDPILTQVEAENMSMVDLGTVGAQILGFFMTDEQRKATGIA